MPAFRFMVVLLTYLEVLSVTPYVVNVGGTVLRNILNALGLNFGEGSIIQ
jgi:hypothetical protein